VKGERGKVEGEGDEWGSAIQGGAGGKSKMGGISRRERMARVNRWGEESNGAGGRKEQKKGRCCKKVWEETG